MSQARRHEWYLYLHNRPLTTLVMRATARRRRFVHLPYIGYLVNDPDLAIPWPIQPEIMSAVDATGNPSLREITRR